MATNLKVPAHGRLSVVSLPSRKVNPSFQFTSALASLYTGRRVRPDTAMTGEITLSGLVLPIGGVKEKVLAAVRAGIATVLLPARNRKDLEDIPETARSQVRFVWVENVDEAVNAALEPGEGASPRLPIAEQKTNGQRGVAYDA